MFAARSEKAMAHTLIWIGVCLQNNSTFKLQVSPYVLMYGRNPRVPLDYLLEWVSSDNRRLAYKPLKVSWKAFKHASDILHKNAERWHRYYKESAKEAPFNIGNTVLFKAHPSGRNKIKDIWSPITYCVVDKLQENVYVIQLVDGIGRLKTATQTELFDLKKLADETDVNQSVALGSGETSYDNSKIFDISSELKSISDSIWVARVPPSPKEDTAVAKPTVSSS